jgi:tRNA modification GTPase
MLGTASYPIDDTIAAIATAPGASARAIVRLSGPCVAKCLTAVFTVELPDGTDVSNGPEATQEALERIHAPSLLRGRVALGAAGRSLRCQLYYWPDWRSFTRSPLAEIHLIGSDPLAAAVLENVCRHGARLACGGEFTLRAFLSGRLDLVQAEAVLGVIEAGSQREFEVALRQLAGGLSGPFSELRDALLEDLAEVEAGLDFVEEDIQFLSDQDLLDRLLRFLKVASALLAQINNRVVAKPSVRVVLVGSPNVGKSSLFNRLTGEKALESETPGTTRDYLSASLDLDGVACELIDTAGVMSGGCDEPIAMAAQSMTSRQRDEANLQLLCLDASRPANQWETAELARGERTDTLVVLTKCDAVTGDPQQGGRGKVPAALCTSSHTGTGIDLLRAEIRQRLVVAPGDVSCAVASTAARCRESLQETISALSRAVTEMRSEASQEIVAAEMRIALDELGRVVGAIYTDDILERIFDRFCIGK